MTRQLIDTNTFLRAGIAPYTIKDGARYFFLCVDAFHGDMTDPGGGLLPGEGFVGAAARELTEETLGMFHFSSSDDIEHIKNQSMCIHNDKSIIIFQPVSIPDLDEVCSEYRRRYSLAVLNRSDDKHIENAYILWIAESDLCRVIAGETVKLPSSLKSIMTPSDVELSMINSMNEKLISRGNKPVNLPGVQDDYPPLYYRIRPLLESQSEEHIF